MKKDKNIVSIVDEIFLQVENPFYEGVWVNIETGASVQEVIDKWSKRIFVKQDDEIRVIHYKEPNNLRDQCVLFAGTIAEATHSKENS
jgi:hypothetical protein